MMGPQAARQLLVFSGETVSRWTPGGEDWNLHSPGAGPSLLGWGGQISDEASPSFCSHCDCPSWGSLLSPTCWPSKMSLKKSQQNYLEVYSFMNLYLAAVLKWLWSVCIWFCFTLKTQSTVLQSSIPEFPAQQAHKSFFFPFRIFWSHNTLPNLLVLLQIQEVKMKKK